MCLVIGSWGVCVQTVPWWLWMAANKASSDQPPEVVALVQLWIQPLSVFSPPRQTYPAKTILYDETKDGAGKTWRVNGSGDEMFCRPPPCFFLPWQCVVGERRWLSRARGALFKARALLDGVLHLQVNDIITETARLGTSELKTLPQEKCHSFFTSLAILTWSSSS